MTALYGNSWMIQDAERPHDDGRDEAVGEICVRLKGTVGVWRSNTFMSSIKVVEWIWGL